jgi:hypothetical protein
MTNQRKIRYFLVVSIVLAALLASAPLLVSAKPWVDHGGGRDPQVRFYVPSRTMVQLNRSLISFATTNGQMPGSSQR